MWWIMRGWGGRVVKSAVYTTPRDRLTRAATRAAVIATIAVVMTTMTERGQRMSVDMDIVMRRGKAREKRERGVRMRMRDSLV
ncbi:hypothetical protein CJF31_00006217 [Rutstroemia sp. NJR-2017a BVV2]|nr:hypothetical protein CJF31_00006217 [Rutstroemia sp. NJR-2017a BVV2]